MRALGYGWAWRDLRRTSAVWIAVAEEEERAKHRVKLAGKGLVLVVQELATVVGDERTEAVNETLGTPAIIAGV